MKKILFVVHRFYPYPGGSEIYVYNMAKEMVLRGYDVTVFTGEHKGNVAGIKVTSDTNIFNTKFDLCIIHGAGPQIQNIVLHNTKEIREKIGTKFLYMIILPDHSDISIIGMNNCDYISWSTFEDLEYIKQYGYKHKSVVVKHGINYLDCIGKKGFRDKYNLPKDKLMFLSSGGYFYNKNMKELVETFKKVQRKDVFLVTTGYDNRFGIMPKNSENVYNFLLEDREDVLSAIKEADCYIMYSQVEGYGLVLLESMLNKTQWIARNGSGARVLNQCKIGQVFNTDEEFINLIENFKVDKEEIEKGYIEVNHNRLIRNTVDDIEKVLGE